MGTTTGQITNITRDGANGTFATDDLIGFSFTLGTASGGLAAGTHSFQIIDNPPTVTISGTPTFAVAGTPFTATFTFSEDVTGFSLSDVTAGLTNATASNFSGSGDVYTADITPSGTGDVVISALTGAATDTASNSSSTDAVTVPMNVAPTANAGPAQTVASGTTPVTLDGSGSTDPDAGQTLTYAWTAPAGTTLTGATTATPSFTAPVLNAGDMSVDLVFSLIVTDNLGLASTAPDTVTITIDPPANVAPTANAGPAQTVASGTAPVTLDGSGSSDPDAGQTLTYAWTAPAGTTLTGATTATPSFTAPVLNAGDASVDLVFSLTVTDNLGLPSTAPDTVTITVDAPANVAPTAEAGPAQTVASGTTPVTLDGSGSTDPDAGQTLTYAWTAPAGTTLTGATTATPSFTAPVLNAGDMSVDLVFSLIVTDNLGLASTAPDTVTITIDAGPTVTLSGAPTTFSNTNPFSVTATFSEDVSGFDDLANDVIVTNGSVTAISDGPSAYTLTIAPTGGGDVAITVVANAAQDSASNGNAASNTVTVGSTIAADTQLAISEFMLDRANNLASNQHGLVGFLQGSGCGNFNVNATGGSGSASGCVSSGEVWASFTSAWSDGSSYTLATFGAHSFVSENFIVGAMLQFDHAEDNNNNVAGTGWLVGPYFAVKAADQPLYLEGRLLYGQTSNEISPLGTFTDDFHTERFLVQVRATGEYHYKATSFMPLLDMTYTDDTQRAYTDSLGNLIGEQKISLTQVTAGMDFRTPVPLDSGEVLNVNGGFSTIYSSTSGGDADFEGFRGRAHLGLNYETPNGGDFNISGFFDGIGSDYQSQGLSLAFEMKF
ncbi:MAG: Ig-like domain-containing protein [Litoreibacter sp.]|uniref:PKD domain-containing protein n=3 Tax=Litoreibacter sp. TaxID=1969459 RepID=UPI00329A3D82